MKEEKVGGKNYKFIIITGAVTLVVTVAGSVISYALNGRIDDKREARKQLVIEQGKKSESEDYLFEAVINDPDGYTNVRNMPDLESEIVDQIQENEVFKVLKKSGEWYEVETPNGVVGFVFHNRIIRK